VGAGGGRLDGGRGLSAEEEEEEAMGCEPQTPVSVDCWRSLGQPLSA
jgi:hypothetical protein